MNSSRDTRAIGFAPHEISALVNRAVVEQHAEDAAFLWTQRERATTQPHYSLRDLTRLDERVEAHLHGLRIAGDAGWEACRELLAGEAPGAAFALGALAFGGSDAARVDAALAAELSPEGARHGFAAALGWLEATQAAPWLHALLSSTAPTHRAIALVGFALHRQDPGPALATATGDVDRTVRALSYRTAGELRRSDLQPALRVHLEDPDEVARFWAAWSLVLLGDPAGMPQLIRAIREASPLADPALRLAIPALAPPEAKRLLEDLGAHPTSQPLAVIGMGIDGDPAAVPLLIDLMTKPRLARVAGEAFSMITGADLSDLDLDGEPPELLEEDDTPAVEYERNLPWPSAERVARWWADAGDRHASGTRYLRGSPVEGASCFATLEQGKQRQRAAAALGLALLDPEAPLFEVRARATWQHRALLSGHRA